MVGDNAAGGLPGTLLVGDNVAGGRPSTLSVGDNAAGGLQNHPDRDGNNTVSDVTVTRTESSG